MNNVVLERSIYESSESQVVIGNVIHVDTFFKLLTIQEKSGTDTFFLYINEISNFDDVPEQVEDGQEVEIIFAPNAKVIRARFIYPEVPGTSGRVQ